MCGGLGDVQEMQTATHFTVYRVRFNCVLGNLTNLGKKVVPVKVSTVAQLLLTGIFM